MKLVAAVPPKKTAVVPVTLVPVMVTLVPPLRLPSSGLTAVIVGLALTPVVWKAPMSTTGGLFAGMRSALIRDKGHRCARCVHRCGGAIDAAHDGKRGAANASDGHLLAIDLNREIGTR